jgi:hypothetical protein
MDHHFGKFWRSTISFVWKEKEKTFGSRPSLPVVRVFEGKEPSPGGIEHFFGCCRLETKVEWLDSGAIVL